MPSQLDVPDAATTDNTRGQVDGTWRPATLDLVGEAPQLVADARTAGFETYSLMYHLGDWASPPRRLIVDGRTLKLAGYRTQARDVITLVNLYGRRLDLLVIPPDTGTDQTPQQAHAAR